MLFSQSTIQPNTERQVLAAMFMLGSAAAGVIEADAVQARPGGPVGPRDELHQGGGQVPLQSLQAGVSNWDIG